MSNYCPECELRQSMMKITPQSIQQTISNMAYQEGITTEPEVYDKRLLICKECSSLRDEIMCSECGSYVAFRARIKASQCPYPGINKWKEI